MRRNESSFAANQSKAAGFLYSFQPAVAKTLDDLIFPFDDFAEIYFLFAQMDAVIRSALSEVSDARAGHHRFRRRASVVNTGTANVGPLDDCCFPAGLCKFDRQR